MNNYGDHSSHSIKVKSSDEAFQEHCPIQPGDNVEIVNDHEGSWYVLENINDLHYWGRPPLAAATHPNFHPEYELPRSARDPNQVIASCYFGGSHDAPFAVPTEEINDNYVKADRRCEHRTNGFRYGNHTGGKGRVSL